MLKCNQKKDKYKKDKNFDLDISNTYEQLPDRFYSFAKESNFKDLEIVIYNENLAKYKNIVDII